MNIYAGLGVAVREFPLGDGEADYLLYADGKVIGVVEAKPEDHGTLAGVEGQSVKYVTSLPNGVPAHALPVPFHYETTGTVTQFTSLLDPTPRSRPVFAFHRPEELLRLVGLERQLRASLAGMPPLADPKLWRVQAEAVTNLEKSLAQNRPRSLVQMATGSGKTFTAISAVYRLIKFGGARRVLFLVDRTNLGRQTYREFQQYVSPYSGHTFTDEFNVQHLTVSNEGNERRCRTITSFDYKRPDTINSIWDRTIIIGPKRTGGCITPCTPLQPVRPHTSPPVLSPLWSKTGDTPPSLLARGHTSPSRWCSPCRGHRTGCQTLARSPS